MSANQRTFKDLKRKKMMTTQERTFSRVIPYLSNIEFNPSHNSK